MTYSFLNEYQLSETIIKEKGMKKICKLKHNFFTLSEFDLKEMLNTFQSFPEELIQFYREIGFGFFHINRGRIHRIVDPQSLIYINLQKDEYKRDKILAESIREGQLVFFDSQAYGYFSLEMNNTYTKNAVYYKGEQVEESLHRFLYNLHNDKNYLKYMKSDAEEMIHKKRLIDKNKANGQLSKQTENTHISTGKVLDKHSSKSSWLLDDDDNIIIS